MSNEKTEKKKFKRSLFHKIVNVFIGLAALLLFLLVVFFGFSQTKTFRTYLRNEIIADVSNSINGNLYIEKIDGSIFSSLILYNTILSSPDDTLLYADEISIKTSPIHLLLKRILIREVLIKNAKMNLLQDKNGIWNISKLSKSKSEEEQDTSGTFPFSIQVNSLRFQNLSFTRQTYSNLYSNKYYQHINPDDLKLKNINLDAKLFANISSSLVRVYLNNFSVEPNFTTFNLKKLTGEFELTKNYAQVRHLMIETDSSHIMTDAKLDGLNLLGDVELKDFKDYPMKVDLEANPFYFNDLSTFVQSTEFLKETAYLKLNARGRFGNFNVNKLDVAFKNSYLRLKGKIQDLNTPEKLYLNVQATNSRVIESEAYELIKGLEIPNYKNMVLDIDTLKFKGEPTRFNASILGKVNDQNINLTSFLDLQKKEIEYNVSFATQNINLFPILGSNSSITSSGTLKGVGTDPENMKANFLLNVDASKFYDIDLDSLTLNGTINSKIFNLDFESLINNAVTSVTGILDLRNSEMPTYDLAGTAKKLNLESFTNDKSDSSNLNFAFSAKGNNLTLDKMVGNFEVKLEPSSLRTIPLGETNIKVNLAKEEEKRTINLVSEFFDFNIDGNFSLEKAVNLLSYEGKTIGHLITQKINELNPVDEDSLTAKYEQIEISPIVNENVEFNYNFKFKDFNLIALLLKNDELDISGSGEGKVKNDSLHFTITTDINIDNLLNKKDSLLLYLSNISTNINFNRDNQEVSFNKIFGSVSLEGDKIYTGVELDNVEADFIFNQSKLFFNTSMGVGENLTADIEGTASTFKTDEKIDFSNFTLNYKNIPWTSFDTSSVLFTESGVQLSNLNFENGNSLISVDGQINNDESHNLFINIENLPGAVLSTYLANEYEKPLEGDVNINLTSSGFLSEPEINADLAFNDIKYNDIVFGSLKGVINHYNNLSKLEIDFNNSSLNSSEPILKLTAVLPLSINFKGDKKFIDEDSSIEVHLKSNDFNLGTFGNLIPYVKNQSGDVQSSIDISGTYAHPITNGFINVENGVFTFTENNLDYSFLLNSTFSNQQASIDKFQIANHSGSAYKGKINATGIIDLEKFPFSKFDISLNGSLALLGNKSKTKNASVYGNLFIKTDNDWKFTYNNDTYNFDGNILVDKADLVYASKNQRNGRLNNQIIYQFVEDSSNINWNNQKFIRILNESHKSNRVAVDKKTKFKLNTNITIRNIASFNFLIDPELNQKLIAETTGQLRFETVGNELKTQGSLELLDGSRLEFFKTFEARGTIRFESDVTDPNLNIVATYVGTIDNFEQSNKTEDVAVKLKINSPLSKLGENLSQENENLSVYVGRSNIDDDIPNTKYDASNALTFILLGQLSLDLNEEQKTALGSVAENAAYSLLGSQLTNYLNSTLGGLVTNIRFNKYATNSYKLLFSGKYNNIRYSFGGNTKYLEWNKTDIKLEYLINPNLILRAEQKDPVVETTTGEKVQELGLKYKFEF